MLNHPLFCALLLSAVVLMYCSSIKYPTTLSVFQGGSHRTSMNDDRDPFRFRHMIATDSLQIRNLASRSIQSECNAANGIFSLASLFFQVSSAL